MLVISSRNVTTCYPVKEIVTFHIIYASWKNELPDKSLHRLQFTRQRAVDNIMLFLIYNLIFKNTTINYQ